ncbi:HD domain-containing protein [Pedobacter sp. MC2016-14]|uniref:HD domain-containing protein n=1 Tax=Pedobacter sp. MC2016-14 TaxID=2897327 RepID=UPI001E482E47|nr:HD domain-containing protein [Pedobacter sp. MC2016-14]MCD0489715.1 HD domain-containing protein [Pedobacter sp. MC2016-14]
MIKVNDPIYGSHELPAVFEDLLNCSTLKRLSNIHHSGAIFLVDPEICHHRLEHSIGVTLLIKMLGGTELEQIAGLLHDVSHTAFSHVGDYVMNNTEETYHEQLFESLLRQSEVPAILHWHGYHIDQILQGHFPILEQPMPLLCADRLDYTLRDAVHSGLISKLQAKNFLPFIKLQEDRIVVTDLAQAEWINQLYKRLNEEFYNAPLYVYANQQLAMLIVALLKSGALHETDLLKDDTFLLNKIRSTSVGYEGIKAIKNHKGYVDFLKKGPSLKIKKRTLMA